MEDKKRGIGNIWIPISIVFSAIVIIVSVVAICINLFAGSDESNDDEDVLVSEDIETGEEIIERYQALIENEQNEEKRAELYLARAKELRNYMNEHGNDFCSKIVEDYTEAEKFFGEQKLYTEVGNSLSPCVGVSKKKADVEWNVPEDLEEENTNDN